jgi:hypothetical protein
MSTLREAAQQALEALDLLDEYDITRAMLTDEAIEQVWATADAATDALRAVLAQEEQEPVVFTVTKSGALLEWEPTVGAFALPDGKHSLYTHPPRREWQRLTEKEIQSIHDTYHKRMGPQEFAHAVEAALKEKNNG